MGQITSLFVWKVIQQVSDLLDQPALFRSVGIEPEKGVDPALMIADTDYYGLLERIAHKDPNATALPLRAGASMRCDDYGAFGLAWKSAATLRGSYERAERYARVLTSVSTYEVREDPEGVLMILHRAGARRLGLRMSNEATIASIVTISKEVAVKAFRPIRVFFKHQAPPSIAAHEDYFKCPIHYDAGLDALLVSKETLAAPNQLGDEGISKFFDTHLEAELEKFDDDASLAQRVRIQISTIPE